MSIGFQKVEPISKKVRVVALVKEAILSGAIHAGEQIVETKLAQEFGVGQGLIREALIELEHQGFVERIPFSGTQVVQFNQGDVEHIFDVRLELEPLAFTLATQQANPAQLAELGTLAEAMKQSAEAGDHRLFFEQNLVYRCQVWKLAGNKYLAQTLEHLVIPLFALYIMREPLNPISHQRMRDGATEQAAVIQAMQAGDAAEAGRLTRVFLAETKSKLHLLLK
ncbi:MAG: GntR family transcriptional regulator [Blastocatellia bacterium]